MNDFEAEELATKRKPLIRFGLLEGIILFLILCAVGGILAPNRTSTGVPAPQTATLSNMKMIGIGAMLYCSDWDDRLPFIEPYEFGDDPIDLYLKNESVHENIFLARRGQRRLLKSTQHEFRFAYAPLILENRTWKRQFVDLQKAKDVATTQLAWTAASDDGSKFIILFGDGHVRIHDVNTMDVRFSAARNGLDGALFGRTNFVPKGAEWPPPTWSIPASDVSNYMNLAKTGKP